MLRRARFVVFQLIEICGDFPAGLQDLIVPLIPKPEGGLRPIGTFRTMFRLHSRCRRAAYQMWERRWAQHPAFNAAGRVSTLDGVWRQSARAEAGKVANMSLLTLLCDLRKCYEHVRHEFLAFEAAG